MGTMHLHPASQPNLPAVARILSAYDRKSLEAFLSIAIDLLDLIDGDPDLEDSNDREAHDGDDQGDIAWIEWHTMRGSQKRGPNILAGQEDDEDDDAAEQDDHEGQCDEDGVNTAFDYVRFTYGASGPGCMLSDPGGEVLAH